MGVFKGTKSFYEYGVNDALAHNLKSWIEYGLIEVGAYTPIKFDLSTSGYTNLQPSYDNRYSSTLTTTKVFEGIGPSWVWESGITGIGSEVPTFPVSGIYINNLYLPSDTTGFYAYDIDYKNGRIIFDNAIPVSSGVKCEYVARDVAVYLTDSPQWKTIIKEYDNYYDNMDDLYPSGLSCTLKENRVWLPTIVIQVEDVTNRPLQLGGGEYNDFNVKYHVLSDLPFSNKRISDLLVTQQDKRLNLFDVNEAPLIYGYNGTLSSGALSYPQLSNRDGEYFWTYASVDKSFGGSTEELSDTYTSQITHIVSVARYLSTY